METLSRMGGRIIIFGFVTTPFTIATDVAVCIAFVHENITETPRLL